MTAMKRHHRFREEEQSASSSSSKQNRQSRSLLPQTVAHDDDDDHDNSLHHHNGGNNNNKKYSRTCKEWNRQCQIFLMKQRRGSLLLHDTSSSSSGRRRRRRPQLSFAQVVLIVALGVVILFSCGFLWNYPSRTSFKVYPIMVHYVRDAGQDMTSTPTDVMTDVTVLQLTDEPRHFITDRHNHYWIDHGTHWHPLLEHEKVNNKDNEDEEESNDESEESDNDSDDDNDKNEESSSSSSCQSMGEWQTERNIITCNAFHEIEMDDPSLINVGGGTFRDAWAVRQYDGDRVVVKTLVWDDDNDYDQFDVARKEAMAMAQSSSWSSHVARIYGYCSHSTIMDYSDKGILWWLFDDFEPTKDDLLQIAYDVAQGVADAQNVDSQGRATIAHMDIKANQFLLINGTYKLNDFNMCEFLKWDVKNEKYCSFEGGYVGRWQAPEQVDEEADLFDEKSDVFSLGYVFYFLLTGDQQWHEQSSNRAAKHTLNGVMPDLDNETLSSTHPFDVAVIAEMKKCLEHRPEDRPTATQVADSLHDALVKAGLA